MGNCQAIDNATLLIQHPSGRVDKMYVPVNASEIMKMNPGHYVALLLTTTYCGAPPAKTTSTTAVTATAATNSAAKNNSTNVPVRITRIKLLRPTDTLALGHVYRLITTQEVMKGLSAKKYAKMKQQHSNMADKQERVTDKLTTSDYEQIARRSLEKTNQARHDRHRIRMAPPANSSSAAAAAGKSRTWHPRLHSISEAGS